METIDALAQTFDHTTKVIAGVRPDQMSAPTPCTEWTVQQLLAHTAGVVANMGFGASGQPLAGDPNDFVLDDDAAAQFRREADKTLAAWKALAPDAVVDIGAGPMPVSLALGINLADTTAHSWDIARATGQDANAPDDVAAMALANASGFISDDIRAMVGFNPAITVPASATPTEKLVAFMGRQP